MEWRDLKRMIFAVVLFNIFDVAWFAMKVLVFHTAQRPDADLTSMKNLVLAAMVVVVAAVREPKP